MPPRKNDQKSLILASGSTYRADQLKSVGLVFEIYPPDIDESPLPGETAAALVKRLAYSKCETVATEHPHAVVIAGDQVGATEDELLYKPGTEAAAIEQLLRCQGKTADFHSACSVYDPTKATIDCRVVPTHLKFLHHPREHLARYVARDKPIDCAGSFKIERTGIILFEYVRADDPTALLGLPMITLLDQLAALDYPLLT